MQNKLILRSERSPYNDITKGSVLSINELDSNLIFLKGETIFSANTSGSDLIISKLNGSEFILPLNNSLDTYLTGGTYNNEILTLTNNNGDYLTISGITKDNSLDTYLTGGTYNNEILTLTNNNGDYLTISGITKDNIFISVTLPELNTLITNENLTPNALYEINGVDVDLYDGTTIYLQAISTSKLNESGVGKFFNPIYNKNIRGFGIIKDYYYFRPEINQRDSGVYEEHDNVIWGGRHWECIQNTDITTKYIRDVYNLDENYFTPINFNEIDYNVVYDEIKYDISNDLIIYRNEKNSNIVSTSKLNNDFMLVQFATSNPIKAFQWGNTYLYGFNSGIGNQIINNSYNENINFAGSSQTNFNFNNNSIQQNLTIAGYQDHFIFNNSKQYNIILPRGSQGQQYLNFNNSIQYNLILSGSTGQANLNFNNYNYDRNWKTIVEERNLEFSNNITDLAGLILTSPNTTKFKIKVSDLGVITATPI